MRHTPSHFLVIAALILSSTVACGNGSTSPTAPTQVSNSSGLGTLTFKVDGGSTVTSTAPTATLAGGILSIGGGVTGTVLGFALTPTAGGTGTYTLGALSPANASLLIGNPAAGWQAGVGIGSGTITISSLTSTTVSGTFSFSVAPVQGTGASGTKSVTDGAFNLSLTTQTPPPASADTSITATVDGVAWSSSVSRRATLQNNFLTLTGQDTNGRVITFVLPFTSTVLIPPSPASVYSLNVGTANQPIVTMVLGAQNWDNSHTGATGSLTITGITQTRVTGTFQVGLVPSFLNQVQTPSQITNGKFDMALERF